MAVQVMRLRFVVHTYLNMTMSDGQGALMVGNRVAERTRANIQSHLVTIDKQVMRMKVQEAFNPDQNGAPVGSRCATTASGAQSATMILKVMTPTSLAANSAWVPPSAGMTTVDPLQPLQEKFGWTT